MFAAKKVKIDKALWEKVVEYAAVAGYSSPDEFVIHTIEKAIETLEDASSDEEIRERLKGLGYIS